MIKVYIVTYKKTDLLIRCLRSLFDGSNNMHNVKVSVMNNYVPNHVPILDLPEDLLNEKITIIHNSARPEFSTGHLARNWNQCIIDGIKDIQNPDCEMIILAQEDAMFAPGALNKISQILKEGRYNYITLGKGDEVQIMTPESVKAIGLYDERFCNIGYQEADYFRRAYLHNPEKSSINDGHHGRVHNPLPDIFEIICDVLCGNQRHEPELMRSAQYNPVSIEVYRHKWHGWERGEAWWNSLGYPDHVPDAKQYMMYPYFEKYLPDLDKKYYCY